MSSTDEPDLPFAATVTFLDGTVREFAYLRANPAASGVEFVLDRNGRRLLVNIAAVQTIETWHNA